MLLLYNSRHAYYNIIMSCELYNIIQSREPQHDNDTYENNNNIVKFFRFAMGINLRVWPSPPALTLTDEPLVCVFLAISSLQVCGDEWATTTRRRPFVKPSLPRQNIV